MRRKTNRRTPKGATFLASGAFNRVYKFQQSEGNLVVYKLQIFGPRPSENAMDTPERSCRVWNEINPEYPAHVYLDGWVAPFIEGCKPTDYEVMLSVLDIYRRTRRVVVDASTPDNFKKQGRKTTCVDVGMALRRDSISSESGWKSIGDAYPKYWHECSIKENRKNTVRMIRLLKHLDENLPPEMIQDKHLALGNILLVARHTFGSGLTITPDRWQVITTYADEIMNSIGTEQDNKLSQSELRVLLSKLGKQLNSDYSVRELSQTVQLSQSSAALLVAAKSPRGSVNQIEHACEAHQP